MDKLEWLAPEHEEKEHSNDWFWALGVIVVCSSVASVIYANYFFAVLIVLGGLMLGFFANQKPLMVTHELGEKGLKIGTRLYLYTNIKAFYVRTETEPALLIHSDRLFMPIISIPISEDIAPEIKSILLDHEVLEEEIVEHSSEKIMNSLGL
jgi:hypothetical protein